MKILPEEQEYLDGTLVKLYNYDLPRPSVVTAGFWKDLNTKLFYPALPITIYENRYMCDITYTESMSGNDECSYEWFHIICISFFTPHICIKVSR